MQHRVADHPFEFEAGLQLGVHRRHEKPDAIAAVGFGLVQRQIGAFQKPRRVGSVRRRQCDTNAHRGNERSILESHWRCYSSDDAPRKFLRIIFVRNPCLEHDEFVAAEPSHDIVDANDRAQTFSNRLEQEIAAVVPKGVIYPLEAIEVEEVHGNAVPLNGRMANAASMLWMSWARFARPVSAS